ncbi:MAG: DNA-binding protein [Oscillospiraceae bacterium]|nr:DNA-binding protein [Oscillospiraceae bacterium]
MKAVLGLDTSNYTTSAAWFDGAQGHNEGRLLEVQPGRLGLRQSEALFQHVKRLPEIVKGLEQWEIQAVGASTRPREVEGSYMPCFLAGASFGESMAHVLNVPFYAFSHQQGHLAAAAWSAGRLDLLEQPFLAWHLSGGTTELLKVEPEGCSVRAEIIGGASDLSAGQLIDRAGVLLGLAFPAGKALDELAQTEIHSDCYAVKLKNLTFSLSGIENQIKELAARQKPPAYIASFTLNTIAQVVRRATQEAQARWPGLPVLCSGGVASNRRLRSVLTQAVFAQPQFSTDNAMGVAILTHRARKEEFG